MAVVITQFKAKSHRKLDKIHFKERFNGYRSGIINKTTFPIQFLDALKKWSQISSVKKQVSG